MDSGIGDLRGKKVINAELKDGKWNLHFEHTKNTLIVSGCPLSIVHFYSMYCDVEFSDVALSNIEYEWERVIRS